MNEPIEIPIPSDVPLFSERITLRGVEYLFQFDWNDRAQRWSLSIFTVDEQPLATGIRIVANWPLLRRFTDPRLPRGTLIAADLSPSQGESPTYLDLGTRVRLMFIPE
jgi:hypothetical protein